MGFKQRSREPATRHFALVDAVRKRPGMYVGDTDDGSGLHHLLWEILANSIDQAIAGPAHNIGIKLHSDGSISVVDDGEGIPIHKVNGVPFAELITTEFHTSPTSDGHSPHIHVALSGVGVAPVSALSEWFTLETRRDGRASALRTERGVLVQRLHDIGPSSVTGTSVRLLPDSDIFCLTKFSEQVIRERLEELAALTPGLRFTLESAGTTTQIHAPTGLASLLRGSSPHLSVSSQHGRFSFEIVWQLEAPEARIDAFTNWQRVGTKGSHVRGLRAGLTDTDGLKLHAVIHVRTTDPNMIYGPMRNELRDEELEAAIRAAVRGAMAAQG